MNRSLSLRGAKHAARCVLTLLAASGCSFVLGFPDIEERNDADAATPTESTDGSDGSSESSSATTDTSESSSVSDDSQSNSVSDSESSDTSSAAPLEDSGAISTEDSGTPPLEDGGSTVSDSGVTSPDDGGTEPFVDSGTEADAGVMCAAPCSSGAECDAPLTVTLLDTATPTDMGMPPDGVLPVGLAAAGDNVFASVRFKPFITNGPDLPVQVAGGAIYQLAPGTPAFKVKTYECHLPNGSAFDGSLAATAEHIYSLITSPAASGSGNTQLASSTLALGSSCEAGAATEVTENNVNNNLVPFVFRFGSEDPLAAFDVLTNLEQGSSVLLDVAANAQGDSVAVVGVTPFAVFGSTSPPQSLNYFTMRLDADTMTPAWVRFTANPPAEIGGSFPSSVTIEAGIAVDDTGDTWVTGTVNATGAYRMFVEHRSADGLRNNYWVAPQASYAKSITVADGHVVVGGNFEGSFDVPSGTLDATGRDFVVLNFNASEFAAGDPHPLWSYPATGMTPAEDFSADDSLAKVAFGQIEGCDPMLYVLSCSGPDCSVNDGLSARLQRLDIMSGEVLSTRQLAPSAGSFAATELVVQSSGVWFGGELKGTLYSRSSSNFVTTGNPAGAGFFGKLRL